MITTPQVDRTNAMFLIRSAAYVILARTTDTIKFVKQTAEIERVRGCQQEIAKQLQVLIASLEALSDTAH